MVVAMPGSFVSCLVSCVENCPAGQASEETATPRPRCLLPIKCVDQRHFRLACLPSTGQPGAQAGRDRQVERWMICPLVAEREAGDHSGQRPGRARCGPPGNFVAFAEFIAA